MRTPGSATPSAVAARPDNSAACATKGMRSKTIPWRMVPRLMEPDTTHRNRSVLRVFNEWKDPRDEQPREVSELAEEGELQDDLPLARELRNEAVAADGRAVVHDEMDV